MLHPAAKRSAMRWVADNRRFRHVLVDDEPTDELLFRFELNTVGSQWLPLAVFRLKLAEFELGAAPRLAPTDLQKGAIVTITKLVNRPELNGERATVRSFDNLSGRYEVQIVVTGEVRR